MLVTVQGLLLLLLFSVLMAFALARGGHGASIADITCGSLEYWVSQLFGWLACWRGVGRLLCATDQCAPCNDLCLRACACSCWWSPPSHSR